jgi:hypothetical protein
MPAKSPETVICTYRVKEAAEPQFRALLAKHWPTLDRLDLVNQSIHELFRGTDESGKAFFVEIFEWKNEDTVRVAHESPQVLSIWEPMEALCEERLGRPALEFPHVERLRLDEA